MTLHAGACTCTPAGRGGEQQPGTEQSWAINTRRQGFLALSRKHLGHSSRVASTPKPPVVMWSKGLFTEDCINSPLIRGLGVQHSAGGTPWWAFLGVVGTEDCDLKAAAQGHVLQGPPKGLLSLSTQPTTLCGSRASKIKPPLSHNYCARLWLRRPQALGELTWAKFIWKCWCVDGRLCSFGLGFFLPYSYFAPTTHCWYLLESPGFYTILLGKALGLHQWEVSVAALGMINSSHQLQR